MSQSTNDVYPTAIKITLVELIYKLKIIEILADCFKNPRV